VGYLKKKLLDFKTSMAQIAAGTPKKNSKNTGIARMSQRAL
jgi:hypothetical protein